MSRGGGVGAQQCLTVKGGCSSVAELLCSGWVDLRFISQHLGAGGRWIKQVGCGAFTFGDTIPLLGNLRQEDHKFRASL